MQHIALMRQREIYREVHWVSPYIYFSNLVLVICSLLIAGGCAVHDPFYQRETLNDRKKAFINNVPFIKQRSDYCGPATLAMLFNFWGMHITQDEIAQEVYSPGLKGTLSIEMVLYAVKQGFEAKMYNGDIQDMKDKIAAGFPLIVSYRTNTEKERVHYMVVMGFDDDKGVVYIHSGEKKGDAMNYETFLEGWGWANNLTFIVYPKKFEVPHEG